MSDYDLFEQQRQYREMMLEVERQNMKREEEVRIQYELLNSQLKRR